MSVPLRVLIVEDSFDDTILLVRELRRGGYDPLHQRVDTSLAMQAALDERAWDIVISDHAMPSFSALDALSLLQRKGLDLPFIILSGTIGEDVAVAAMKAGAHDYIMKGHLARLNPAVERELREAEGRWERQRAEKALQESEARKSAILHAALDAIVTIDHEARIVEFNLAAETMFGYSRTEAVGRVYADLILPPAAREPQRRGLAHYLATGEGPLIGQRIETVAQRKDGSAFPVEIAITRIPSDGPPAFTGFIRDLTEQKRAESALRDIRAAERRRIARDLHDVVLQDLVYALQGLQISQARAHDAGGGFALGNETTALRRAVQGLRNAIYDLRGGDAHEQDVIWLVELLIEMNRQMSPQMHVALSVEGEVPKLPGPVSVELSRIVHEALVNGRRHAKARHMRVTLGSDGHTFWAEIADDGRGFEPQATLAGVGLAAMRERALALGGEVEIRSAFGEGTRVLFHAALATLLQREREPRIGS